MPKHVETFYANKGYKLTNEFYTSFFLFKIEFYGKLFKRYLNKNDALYTQTFYMKMNRFKIWHENLLFGMRQAVF